MLQYPTIAPPACFLSATPAAGFVTEIANRAFNHDHAGVTSLQPPLHSPSPPLVVPKGYRVNARRQLLGTGPKARLAPVRNTFVHCWYKQLHVSVGQYANYARGVGTQQAKTCPIVSSKPWIFSSFVCRGVVVLRGLIELFVPHAQGQDMERHIATCVKVRPP